MKRIIKFIVPLILLGFLSFKIIQDWSTVEIYLQNFNILPLILGFLVMLTIYPEGALCWWSVLRNMGIKVRLASATRIWIISNTSRYIPGKIWQYLGRIELAKREAGISRGKTIFSLMLEIFLVLIAAGVVSMVALPFVEFKIIGGGMVILLLPLSLILLHPKIANFILRLLAKVSRNKINIFFPLSFGSTLSIFPLYILNFLINGLALYLLVVSLYGDINISFYHILAFSGFYAFSWVVGFLSFFAPGGLGVTEITLSYLLGFLMPLSLAFSITLLYRFLLTLAELLIFGLFLKPGGKS